MTTFATPINIIGEGGTNSYAFPGFAIHEATARFLAVWRSASTHSGIGGGIAQKISEDRGFTWGTVSSVIAGGAGGFDYRGADLTLLDDDRIVMVAERRGNAPAEVTNGGATLITEDGGDTWSSPVEIDTGFTDYGRAMGPIIVTPAGDWLCTVYGEDTGDAQTSTRVIISDDEGATWSLQGVVAEGGTDPTEAWNEAGLFYRADGTLCCIVRQGLNGHWDFATSDDDGVTWSALTRIRENASGHPSCGKFGDYVVAVYRDVDGTGDPAVVILSEDEGETWTDIATISSTGGLQMTYGSPRFVRAGEENEGDLYIVFAYEAADNNSDVYITAPLHDAPDVSGVTFTDTTVTVGLGPYNANFLRPHALHTQTQFQITTAADTGFSSPFVNLTTSVYLLAAILEGLTASTAYIGRVRTGDGWGLGEWSETFSFTTQAGLPTPTTPTLSDPPTDVDEDQATLTVSGFAHSEGTTTAELYDVETNDLPYPVARQWQITVTADTGFTADPMVVDTDLNSNIDTVRLFTGLAAGTAYRARTRVKDGKYGTNSAWSNVVVFTTDTAPVDRPGTPEIALVSCGPDGVSLTGDAFVPFDDETHHSTQWRARPHQGSNQGADAPITTNPSELTAFSWGRMPAGTWYFDVRYRDSDLRWSEWSDVQPCVIYPKPPVPEITDPVSGVVISANQTVTIAMPSTPAESWNFVWDVKDDIGGSWSQVQSSTSLTYNFPVLGKVNGYYWTRVKACYPVGHDAEGQCSDWGYVLIYVDRTGVRAFQYDFRGLADSSEIPGNPVVVWDGVAQSVNWLLVDEFLGGDGLSVGILAKNSQQGALRQSNLVFQAPGKPLTGRFTVSFAIVPTTNAWWGHIYTHAHQMRAGVAYRVNGTGATDRNGLQMVVHSGVEPWGFYPQGCICDCGVGLNPYCICCDNGECDPCERCHGMPTACRCLQAQTELARKGRTQASKYWQYGVAPNQAVIQGYARANGSGGNIPGFITSANVGFDGSVTRGLEVSYNHENLDEEIPVPCYFRFQRYTMDMWVTPVSGSQVRIRSRVVGPGTDEDTPWDQDEVVTMAETGDQPCGYCGLALYHLASHLTDDHGVLFMSFAGSDLEYEGCEAPTALVGCEADWDFTTFTTDDVTPHYGSYSGDFLTGSVTEASYYTVRTCPRPHLKEPKDFSETEIDYAAGASRIGQITVSVVDKRLTNDDQDTGIVTAFAHDYIGRRAVLRRWREDLGMVTVFDGVIDSYEIDSQTVVTYHFHLRDPRERERDVELFSVNETFSVYPEPGPIENYGLLPSGGYLLPAVAVGTAQFFLQTTPVTGTDGIHSGYVRLDDMDWEDVEEWAYPHGYATKDPLSVYYLFHDITVRWRPVGGDEGDWIYLRDMPIRYLGEGGVGSLLAGTQVQDNAIIPPVVATAALYMGSFTAADLPDHEDLIEVQILAARTTEQTPFMWDRGTYGDLLTEIYDGEHTLNPPRIRYNPTELASWAVTTPTARMIVRAPAKNLREWVQENIYAAVAHAPSFDENMRITPSAWQLPDASEDLVEIDVDWLIPVGEWSDNVSSVINRVKYTYIRESVLEAGSILRDAVLGTDTFRWERFREEFITLDTTYELSAELFGPKEIEYEPVTVRSIGFVDGVPFPFFFGGGLGARLAEHVTNLVLTRYANGAPEYVAGVRAGMAHGPTFDPFTLDIRAGQWLKVRGDWLPEYSEGRRGAYRYMQVKGITDTDIARRRFRLEDGGPVVLLEGESEGEEDLLDPPTIGTLTETSDFRVEVPITEPVGAPSNYRTRVEYAVNATEPAATSGLWTLAGYLDASGDMLTPSFAPGDVVWIRARGEAFGRRPSVWTASETITISQTPGLTFLIVEAVEDESAGCTVSLTWTPNAYAEGLRIRYSVGAIGHTPSYSLYGDVDSDSPTTISLTGVSLDPGEEIVVEVTAYPTFSGGSVSGDPGSVYVVKDSCPAADAGGGGVSDFLSLNDTPSSYSGQAGKFVAVNEAETALEFVDEPSGSGYAEGTSFPVSPATDEKFYRTDRNILYFYDGTRWLSAQLFTQEVWGFVSPNASASAGVGRGSHVLGAYDIYVIDAVFAHLLSGTGNWTLNLQKVNTSGTATTIGTSGAFTNTTRVRTVASVNAVVPTSDNITDFFLAAVENSGTATLILAMCAFTYRLVG